MGRDVSERNVDIKNIEDRVGENKKVAAERVCLGTAGSKKKEQEKEGKRRNVGRCEIGNFREQGRRGMLGRKVLGR